MRFIVISTCLVATYCIYQFFTFSAISLPYRLILQLGSDDISSLIQGRPFFSLYRGVQHVTIVHRSLSFKHEINEHLPYQPPFLLLLPQPKKNYAIFILEGVNNIESCFQHICHLKYLCVCSSSQVMFVSLG